MAWSKSGKRASSALRMRELGDAAVSKPVHDSLALSDMAQAKEEAVFEDTIKEFVHCGHDLVEVVYEDARAGIVGLGAAIKRLGLDAEVEAWLDDSLGNTRIILERMDS